MPEKCGIRIGEAADMPYGREVNIIDMTGIYRHFLQQRPGDNSIDIYEIKLFYLPGVILLRK